MVERLAHLSRDTKSASSPSFEMEKARERSFVAGFRAC
jgi:hypothetical protein